MGHDANLKTMQTTIKYGRKIEIEVEKLENQRSASGTGLISCRVIIFWVWPQMFIVHLKGLWGYIRRRDGHIYIFCASIHLWQFSLWFQNKFNNDIIRSFVHFACILHCELCIVHAYCRRFSTANSMTLGNAAICRNTSVTSSRLVSRNQDSVDTSSSVGWQSVRWVARLFAVSAGACGTRLATDMQPLRTRTIHYSPLRLCTQFITISFRNWWEALTATGGICAFCNPEWARFHSGHSGPAWPEWNRAQS